MSPSTSTGNLPEYVVVVYPGVNHFAGRPLELRHHPKNLYANALVSERGSAEKSFGGTGTVLCIATVRRKKSDPNCVQAKVIGMVSTVYTFKSMCDFHYLPIRQSETVQGCFENLVPKLIPLDLPCALSWWNQPENKRRIPLHLPPYQFSRYSVPSSKLLCKETDFSPEKVKRKSAGHGQSLRSERKALSVTVHSTAEFPNKPTEEAVNDANIRCKNDEPHRLLQELFEERPMWTRVGILKKTGLDDGLIKTLLQKFAFYILNGPWGRLWCRFGYDPRTDPNKNSERPGHVSVTSASSLAPAIPSTYGSLTDEHIDFAYTPGELPRVRQMWYCICDVKLPIAEEIVRKEFFAHGEKADSQNGWLPPKAVDRIRDAIKEDVKKLSNQIEEEEGIPDETEEDWWIEQSTDQQNRP
uniref:Tau95 domain-containing protein n=1 Tax=Elaeophora elaphi TaxID=1147741 RepID=A0A0R3S266_9BILA